MAIPDGTYILVDRDGERIMGECWAIKGGKREKISEEGEEVGVEKEKAYSFTTSHLTRSLIRASSKGSEYGR